MLLCTMVGAAPGWPLTTGTDQRSVEPERSLAKSNSFPSDDHFLGRVGRDAKLGAALYFITCTSRPGESSS
jgi:hypothetical protein